MITIDPDAVLARLRALDERSGGRRVAWTPAWSQERERLASELRALPAVAVVTDPCGNLWATLDGEDPRTLVLGSHLDCVPGGGWLDGCLGVMVAAELLSAAARGGRPRCTLALVDWADEEGARFGRSLFGSAAATGQLSAAELAGLLDERETPIALALAEHGVKLQAIGTASPQIAAASAYLELHIEQGPVLEAQGRSCAAVAGCIGVRRSRLTFTGEAGHAGTVPMERRRDPVRAAAAVITAALDAARALDGLATVGELQARPGTATAVAVSCQASVDLRHRELAALQALEASVLEAAGAAAGETDTTLAIEPLFSIDPVEFDPTLVAAAVAHTGGLPALTSGALHDAASLARAGIPTAMVFAASRGGVSHSRAEDSSAEDLRQAISAFAALADSTVARLAPGAVL